MITTSIFPAISGTSKVETMEALGILESFSVASLIEGGSLWLVITYVPTAARALVVPALIVALLYKIGHLEDWNRYDVVMLLLFQGVLISVVMCLLAGLFLTALGILLVLALALVVLAAFARGL
jgi:MFS superfamily sulfate permease-like transporter